MPTIIGIHNGVKVGEVIGANQAAILSLIKKYFFTLFIKLLLLINKLL